MVAAVAESPPAASDSEYFTPEEPGAALLPGAPPAVSQLIARRHLDSISHLVLQRFDRHFVFLVFRSFVLFLSLF